MRDFVGKRAKNLKPSGIRKFFDLAAGRKDVISLGVGEPDFITPWYIRDAAITALKCGYTQYTSNKGIVELRAEISEYLSDRFNANFDKDDIIVTMGASEAIDLSLRAVVDEGDEILIPDPSYVSYAPIVSLLGGVPVAVPTNGDNGFKLTADNLEKVITEKTKALIFPYPNNPTGGVMEKEYIQKIIPVLLKHDLLVISDEIYAELTYGGEHCSIASFPEMNKRVVLIGGFSKSFAMTGWRIGFVCADAAIMQAMLKIHQYAAICAPIFSQHAALAALKIGKKDGFSAIKDMREEYDKRRKFMLGALKRMGLNCFEPKGSFYVFPCVKNTGLSGEEFATELLNKKSVAVVPGIAFGEFGSDYIRCSYAYSMEALKTAMDKIGEFVAELVETRK